MLFWPVLFVILWTVEAGIVDQCDWTGSGLTPSVERGVTPVYLRCREGTVSWLYPRGALRLLFRPSLPSGQRDFKVCVRVIRRQDPPDLFHELNFDNNDTDLGERFSASLYIEGVHKLVPLYAPDDGDPRELRCFHSRKGRAALYVEAEPEDGPQRRLATLKYEARPLVRKHYDPMTADCRPCTEAEMELAFCTSDLVSRGMIVGSEERAELDSTRLTLRLTKLIRAASTDTSDGSDDAAHDDYYRYDIDNSLPTSHRTHVRRRTRSLHAHVHVSSVCGAAAGAGEFLLMARRRLGKLSLVCAPRVEDWIKLAEQKNKDGTAHCVLQH